MAWCQTEQRGCYVQAMLAMEAGGEDHFLKGAATHDAQQQRQGVYGPHSGSRTHCAACIKGGRIGEAAASTAQAMLHEKIVAGP